MKVGAHSPMVLLREDSAFGSKRNLPNGVAVRNAASVTTPTHAFCRSCFPLTLSRCGGHKSMAMITSLWPFFSLLGVSAQLRSDNQCLAEICDGLCATISGVPRYSSIIPVTQMAFFA